MEQHIVKPGQLWDFGGTGYIRIEQTYDWGGEKYVDFHYTADEDWETGEPLGGGCSAPVADFINQYRLHKDVDPF